MLTGALKADWIQLPVERYLIEFPSGVFRSKDASSWTITRAEKLQVSVFLPSEQSMENIGVPGFMPCAQCG